MKSYSIYSLESEFFCRENFFIVDCSIVSFPLFPIKWDILLKKKKVCLFLAPGVVAEYCEGQTLFPGSLVGGAVQEL